MNKQITLYSFKERIPEHEERIIVFLHSSSFISTTSTTIWYPGILEPDKYNKDYFEFIGNSSAALALNISKNYDLYVLQNDLVKLKEKL